MLLTFLNTEMVKSEDLNQAIEDKFISKDKFSNEIELLVSKTSLNYIDAIVEYCEQNEIEVETVGKLISKPLKEKIRCDAMELNYLKRTTRAKLPF